MFFFLSFPQKLFIPYVCVFSTVCVLYTQGMGNKEWREVSVLFADHGFCHILLFIYKFYIFGGIKRHLDYWTFSGCKCKNVGKEANYTLLHDLNRRKFCSFG